MGWHPEKAGKAPSKAWPFPDSNLSSRESFEAQRRGFIDKKTKKEPKDIQDDCNLNYGRFLEGYIYRCGNHILSEI